MIGNRASVVLLPFLMLICVVPFLSLWRVGPLSSFFLEAMSLLFALVLVVFTVCGTRAHGNWRASVYFLLLAVFWWGQARLMNVPYVGQSDQVVWIFVVLALLSWATRAWVREVGQKRVVTMLAWALAVGALLQSAVAWMQWTGWAAHFPQWLMFRGQSEITGQLGQRNHLGHYLMWGALAAGWLCSARQMPTWLGALWALAITITMGLVNSRTIVLYVVLVGVWLVWWRCLATREGNRLTWVMGGVLLSVVCVQLGLNHVLNALGLSSVQTALSRVGESSFAMSARDLEWHKAWEIFLQSPWFGHGWSSFSAQGFWAEGYPNGFSPYGNSVLFTHAHNLVLQLLSEMGIVGLMLVLCGAVWVVKPFFRRHSSPASFLPIALMAVSLCHSLVEYPLWYAYFLVPFALMMSLMPDDDAHAHAFRFSDGIGTQRTARAVLLVSVMCIAGLLRLAWVYQDLRVADSRPKNDTAQQVNQKIQTLREISQNEPMLAHYADLSLTHRVSPDDDVVSTWASDVVQRAFEYRPYATAYKHALFQARLGHIHEAKKWMRQLYHYYPNMMAFYGGKISQPLYSSIFWDDFKQACADYMKVYPQKDACAKVKQSNMVNQGK